MLSSSLSPSLSRCLLQGECAGKGKVRDFTRACVLEAWLQSPEGRGGCIFQIKNPFLSPSLSLV